MQILSQFLLRLAFGLAVGMAITSPQKVFSGFFRNHLYVTLGLTTLAALALGQIFIEAAMPAAVAAACSYIGAACWLYEAKRAGMVLIWCVAGFSFLAAYLAMVVAQQGVPAIGAVGAVSEIAVLSLKPLGLLSTVSIVTSGLTLGVTFATMLLGHWYLNAPGMELMPLRRLIIVAAFAVAAQMIVAGAGLLAELLHRPDITVSWLLFIVLRWSFGLFGVLGLLWMAWQTLKIPNTQSATGILYVAVIGVFVGELTGLLLSAESAFPL